MPIQLTCTSCGRTLQVKEEWAGRTGRCPHCGAAIRIPEAQPIAAEPVRAAPAPQAAAPPPRAAVSRPAASEPQVVEPVPLYEAGSAPSRGGEERAGTFLTAGLDALLGAVRISRPDGFHRYLDAMCKVGLFSLLAAGGLLLIDSIVGAIQSKSLDPLWMGLGVMLGAVVLHYVSAKFSATGLRLITAEPQGISSRAFIDCVGLLLMVLTVAMLVSGVIAAFRTSHAVVRGPGFADVMVEPQTGVNVVGLITALGTCMVMAHVAIAAVSERVVNMKPGVMQGAAGEEALGIVAYILRLGLIGGRTLLAYGATIGTVAVAWVVVAGWVGKPVGASKMQSAMSLVMMSGLAPLAAYLWYVLVMLSVDVCRAVFRVARNTEK